MIGEVTDLHPIFKSAVEAILKQMRSWGWDPTIGSGMRTSAQQEALYGQGRDALEHVNALRLRAKLPPIGEKENQSVVTRSKAGKSYHNMPEAILAEGRERVVRGYGYAVDIVDRKHGWNIKNKKFWQDLGKSAKSHGCEWGGDWKHPDPAHVQMLLIDMAAEDTITV